MYPVGQPSSGPPGPGPVGPPSSNNSSSSGLGTTGIGLGIGPVLGTTASSPVGLQLTPGDSPPGGIPTILGATSLGTSIEPLQTG
eukprot:13538.XXX_115851_115183_1 [CDS] Oithona nana genome sequencing.